MALIVFISSWIFYLLFQTTSIYGGDAGDLVSAAYLHGVAHPPGFPLYTLLAFITSKLPFFTVAWRVGLISSLAGAGTVTILFLLIRSLTRDTKASILAVATLGTTYLFWLYSIVSEVFLLHCFFSSLLIYLLYQWHQTKKDKYLSWFALTLGFSLSHHLLTIFLFPGFAYLIFSDKKKLPKLTPRYLLKKALLLSTGLTSYLYIFFAAWSIPAISWDNATNITNFLNLVLRRAYGTFQSGPIYAQTFFSRMIQIPYVGEFTWADFTTVGIILAFVGCIAQYKRDRRLWIFFMLIFLFVGPLYFFYASYYIVDRFSLATFERFLLSSYLIITVWIGEGIVSTVKGLIALMAKAGGKNTVRKIQKTSLSQAFYLIFLILPLALLFINYSKVSTLKNDRTAENHARDILSTVPKNSIVILQFDTSLFDTQYVYYIQHFRPDVKLLHFYKLYMGELTDQLKKYYPDVIVPPGKKEKFMDDFIKANMGKFPIYLNDPIPIRIKESYWVRYGLLHRFYTKDTLPKPATVLAENERLWSIYSDPLSGSLGKYKNLMLSNVLDFYRDARVDLGKLYEDAELYDKALGHYAKALELDPDYEDAGFRSAITYAKQGKCESAKKQLEIVIVMNPNNADYYYSMQQLYKGCFKDDRKAALFEKLYQEKLSASQRSVEKL